MSVNKVAVVFDDLTEFFAIRGEIDALLNEKIAVDIFIAPSYSSSMLDSTRDMIMGLGYTVKEQLDSDTKYKVLLEPYPIKSCEGLRCDYRIKYTYGASTAKPRPVFLPEWNIPYDASIQYSKRDAEIRGVYGKSYVVPYLKYKHFKKETTKGKPSLLYLPTFGEVSSVDALSEEVVAGIKDKYNLIIKAHHAIEFRQDEQGNYRKIKKIADEFYNSDTPLESLLARVDVVLSDNSGAIFEAIYSETPVAVFSNKLNERKLGGIDTFQYELVKSGVIPCAQSPNDIISAIDEAKLSHEKQIKIKQQYFVTDAKDWGSDFVSVIKDYLSRDRKTDYYAMSHDIALSDFNDKNCKILSLESKVQELEKLVSGYENSVSWKVTQPLRKVNKITRRTHG